MPLRSLVGLAVLAAVQAAAQPRPPAAPAAPASTVPGAPQVIAAPHYGDTLFHFYQDRSFAAITGLMVSQHFGRISPHDDEAEVLRGGMLLAYGLHDEAETVFARLIERKAPPEVQNRAWYYLARLRHQRGLGEQASQALARITAPLTDARPGSGAAKDRDTTLEEDHQLLRAQLLLEAQDHAGAMAVLQALQAAQMARAAAQKKVVPAAAAQYASFNLGVAMIRAGDAVGGERVLDAVGQTPAPDEEMRSLRDRANVALGFAALAAKKPREARLALERVRLQGPQSNKALLGFGWAAAELKDPQRALVPWSELASRGSAGGADASVLEARIAVPYALAELRAYQSALQGYQQAAEGFEQEQRALRESIEAIRAGKLVQGLLAENREDALAALGSASGIRTLPEMPHAAHLAPLLAGHAFQEAFKNLRDLQFLDRNLAQWQDNLGAYGDMLEARRTAFAQMLPAARASTGAADIAALVQRREQLAQALEKAQAEGDAHAFANEAEQALLARIERSQATLQAAAALPPDVQQREGLDALSAATERLRRAAGALQWQLSQQFSARTWEARKALRDTDLGLAQARERDAALLRAQQEEPARHAHFAERIAQLGQRVVAMRPMVATTTALVQAQLQDIAVTELQGQQERLAVYAAQARLAIAQIHDQAQFARRADAGAAAAASSGFGVSPTTPPGGAR